MHCLRTVNTDCSNASHLQWCPLIAVLNSDSGKKFCSLISIFSWRIRHQWMWKKNNFFLEFFCYSFIPIPWLDLKTNSHTDLTNRLEISISNCFRIQSYKLNLWVTVSKSTVLVFSAGAQSFVLLGANMGANINRNINEDSQVKLCPYECMSII